MLPALIIVFREGFEAFLSVAIILTYLKKTGRHSLRPAVYWGIAVSLVASAALGFVLGRVNQPLWEGVLGIVAIFLVSTFVIHIWKTAPRLKQNVEQRLETYSSNRSRLLALAGVFFFTVLMVTREGMETALMLIQVRTGRFVLGALVGLGAAAAMSWAWAQFGHRIDVRRFFQVTGLFLLLFTIQIGVYSIHEFSEAGLLPNSEAVHAATEPYSPVGVYGRWFSVVLVLLCGAWLAAVTMMDRWKRSRAAQPVQLLLLVAALMLVPFALAAQEQPHDQPPAATQQTEVAATKHHEQVTVVGDADKLAELPGSAHRITLSELEQQDHSDIHRVLRTIPGINVQEEEGHGLRPNIGMRGTGVERSSKIAVLEDGVLIAPAPYSAPAAYYFPVAGRMEMVEVRKGSSSITQGPYTTGGVLNLISTSIPSQFSGRVNVAGGEDATMRLHANVGSSGARFGWLIETYQLQTDGFKRLDDGANTGFDLEDYVGKFRFNSSRQAWELKLGFTRHDGHETYLGLTDADFRHDPFRRYTASGEDFIDAEHTQAQLRHFIQVSPVSDLTTTVYRNDFRRNWYKLDSVSGTGISRVLEEPENFASALALLKGEAEDRSGALRMRNNRRSYYSTGVQSVFSTAVRRHAIELGLRLHQDEEDRFQEDDRYGMINGRMTLVSRGIPGTNANRIGRADAISFFIQDKFAIGQWSFTPGARLESINLEQRDFGASDPTRAGADVQTRRNQLDVLIPGLGVHYRVSPTIGAFVGVHRGFAPPGPGTTEGTRAEESVNYEAGVRRTSGDADVSLVAFFNDYSNLLGRDTSSSGGTGSGDLFNGGEVETSGLEFSFGTNLASRFGMNLDVPIRFAYTFTEAEFQNSFETTFEDWAPRVTAGDELAYLPRNQWGGSIGVTTAGWSAFLNLSYTDAMRTRAGRGPLLPSQSTDEHMVIDVSTDYVLPFGVKAFAQVRNLTDATYVSARRPAGLRPGLPRTTLLGLAWSW